MWTHNLGNRTQKHLMSHKKYAGPYPSRVECRDKMESVNTKLDTASAYHLITDLFPFITAFEISIEWIATMTSQIGAAPLNIATSYHMLINSAAEYTRSYRSRPILQI